MTTNRSNNNKKIPILTITTKQLTLLLLLLRLPWLILSYMRNQSRLMTLLLCKKGFPTFIGYLFVHLHMLTIIVLCKNSIMPLILIVFMHFHSLILRGCLLMFSKAYIIGIFPFLYVHNYSPFSSIRTFLVQIFLLLFKSSIHKTSIRWLVCWLLVKKGFVLTHQWEINEPLIHSYINPILILFQTIEISKHFYLSS